VVVAHGGPRQGARAHAVSGSGQPGAGLRGHDRGRMYRARCRSSVRCGNATGPSVGCRCCHRARPGRRRVILVRSCTRTSCRIGRCAQHRMGPGHDAPRVLSSHGPLLLVVTKVRLGIHDQARHQCGQGRLRPLQGRHYGVQRAGDAGPRSAARPRARGRRGNGCTRQQYTPRCVLLRDSMLKAAIDGQKCPMWLYLEPCQK
jgi:hypothetical protein